jgi:hypothetical protein
VWGRKHRDRRRDWPSPEEIDDVVEGSRVRTAWIARARCEAILGNVAETVEALDR